MTRTLLILTLLTASIACNHPPPQASPAPAEEKEHTDEPQHDDKPRRIAVTPQILTASGVTTEPVRLGTLAPTVDLVGEITADPDATAVVTVPVAGRIASVRFKEGQTVTQGALLAVVESAELARARAARTSAAARAAAATRNADRLASLSASGLASGQEVEAARAEATSQQAEADAARQALAAFGPGALVPTSTAAQLPIFAPLGGVVLSRDAVIGEQVGPDHTLARLARLDRAYFTARLFEKNLAAMETGAHADVRLNAYPEEVFSGVVEIIGRQLDPTARTVVARIALADRNGLLKLGLFGTARVVTRGEPNAGKRLLLPLTAVTRISGHDVVFVKEADGDFEVHNVTVGSSAGGQVEILSGLREGEVVAVTGVFALKSIVLKSTFGEEDE